MSEREDIASDIITKLDAVSSPIEFKKILLIVSCARHFIVSCARHFIVSCARHFIVSCVRHFIVTCARTFIITIWHAHFN